jgi:hypothetical protein
LASSLQTAYNLRALPTLIQGLSKDLCDAVEERIRTAFDLSRISKEVVSKGMSDRDDSSFTDVILVLKKMYLHLKVSYISRVCEQNQRTSRHRNGQLHFGPASSLLSRRWQHAVSRWQLKSLFYIMSTYCQSS